jgi:hypothetical protein
LEVNDSYLAVPPEELVATPARAAYTLKQTQQTNFAFASDEASYSYKVT